MKLPALLPKASGLYCPLLKLRISTFIAVFLFVFFASTHVVSAQGGSVSGVVKDENGMGLQGVNVVIKGTTTGVITGSDGRFTITLPGNNATLVISYIGYTPQEVAATSGRNVDVALVKDEGSLDDVVVVGYGTQRKRDVTGAVSTIDIAATKDVPAVNPARMMVGQAPGVQVRQPTGQPGRQFEVVVRGLGSLGAGNQPLYVIDGFAIGNQLGQNVNPNDIESISILKDAVSTAIYGARGSNGVVLITTKTAKSGKIMMNASANFGIQNVPDSRKTKMLNGPDFAQFKKDIFMDKIRAFEGREPSIEEVPLGYRYPEQTTVSTNWFNEILHENAPFSDYNVLMSQGTDTFNLLLSAGYIKQQGILLNTNFDQISARANLGGIVKNTVRLGLMLNGSHAGNKLARATEGRDQIVGAALIADPREPVYNEDGTYNAYLGGEDGVFGFPNPVMMLKEIQRTESVSQLLATAFAEVTFLKHFKFKTVANGLLNYINYKEFVPSTIPGVNAPPPRDATVNDISSNRVNYATDQLLTYTNKFGLHSVEALLGYTAQQETFKNLSTSGSQFPNDLTPYVSSAAQRVANAGEYGWTMNAGFARLNYSFDEKYLFSATFRREGSSRFGADVRYANFPAFSAGWRIGQEKFLSDVAWLTDLKIRGSWGITGNNDIPNYASLSFMSNNNYILSNNLARGLTVGGLPNPLVKWEKSKQLDLGIDLSAFNDRLFLSAEFYNKITTDMLLPIQIPAISGFTSYFSNIGKVQNRGFEFSAVYRTKVNKVGLSLGGNISFNRNKVLEIRGENDQILSGGFYATYMVSKVGRPIGMLTGYKVVGLFNSEEEIAKWPTQEGAIPGVHKVLDANGDGVISYDMKDMVEIGNPWPKFTYGLTLGADYKNFDLSVLITGAHDYDIYRQIESSTMNMDGVFNVLEISKERWRSPENPGNGKYATTNTWKWERESSSRYVYDASHIWIRNVSLGYTLTPRNFLVDNVRIYVGADNLSIISDYPGANPDINSSGGIYPGWDDEFYPLARTFTLGVNLKF